MIMQLINFQSDVTLSDPNNHPNSGTALEQTSENNFVIDDGFNAAPLPIGQPLTLGDYSWVNVLNSSSSGTSYDAPILIQPGLFHKSLSYSASFKTFLMYKPSGGVWIALSEYDRNFSASTVNSLFPSTTHYNWAPPVITQPSPTRRTPSGGEEFPAWGDNANSLKSFHIP